MSRQRFGWAVVLFSLLSGGCATTVELSETYMKPAEINMLGRKTVVLEAKSMSGSSQSDVGMVLGRLSQALLAQEFTVVDRSSMDAKAREQFFSDEPEVEIESASVLIRVGILRNTVKTEREKEEKINWIALAVDDDDSDKEYMAYRTVARADTEVSFDVVDLGSMAVLTSSTIKSSKSVSSDWSREGYGSVDSAAALSKSYDDVIDQFMRKIAPYTVKVDHDIYSMSDTMPQASVGVALLQAGNASRAYEEFSMALDIARSQPEPDSKSIAQLLHNMAVAREYDDLFDEALELYVESTRYDPDIDQSGNIARLQQRLRDKSALEAQGVDV